MYLGTCSINHLHISWQVNFPWPPSDFSISYDNVVPSFCQLSSVIWPLLLWGQIPMEINKLSLWSPTVSPVWRRKAQKSSWVTLAPSHEHILCGIGEWCVLVGLPMKQLVVGFLVSLNIFKPAWPLSLILWFLSLLYARDTQAFYFSQHEPCFLQAFKSHVNSISPNALGFLLDYQILYPKNMSPKSMNPYLSSFRFKTFELVPQSQIPVISPELLQEHAS